MSVHMLECKHCITVSISYIATLSGSQSITISWCLWSYSVSRALWVSITCYLVSIVLFQKNIYLCLSQHLSERVYFRKDKLWYIYTFDTFDSLNFELWEIFAGAAKKPKSAVKFTRTSLKLLFYRTPSCWPVLHLIDCLFCAFYKADSMTHLCANLAQKLRKAILLSYEICHFPVND